MHLELKDFYHICIWDWIYLEFSICWIRGLSSYLHLGLEARETFGICQWSLRSSMLRDLLMFGKLVGFLSCFPCNVFEVFDLNFNPNNDNQMVSCGVKHIKFWKWQGNSLKPQKGARILICN